MLGSLQQIVTVCLEGLRLQWLGQCIRNILLRRAVDDARNLLTLCISNKMVPDIDVLGARRGTGIACHADARLIVLV